MSDIVERLRAGEPCAACWGDTDGTCKVKDARSGCGCAEAADTITSLRKEVERLKGIEELYRAGCAAWNPVFNVVLDERDALRAEVERLRAGLEQAVSRGCNHCIDLIAPARSLLTHGEG